MAHCTKCGAAVADGAAFCPACGAPQGVALRLQVQVRRLVPQGATSQMAENVAGLLCYVLGWITGLIFYFVDKRPFVRFHAAQSIVVFGGLHIIYYCSGHAFWDEPVRRRLRQFFDGYGCLRPGRSRRFYSLDSADDQGVPGHGSACR